MKEALGLLAAGKDLPEKMMEEVVKQIMQGKAEPAAVGALLMGLTCKGESIAEITAAARVMRQFAKEISIETDDVLVDVVGTGGDGANLFNVSTASALMAAAGGVKVAKHGNIAASSSSGSADVLREAGVALNLEPEQVAQCVRDCGFGFMFAQAYHQAMRYVVPVRKAMGIRTIFNVLGPLANPAGVSHQIIGVFSAQWLRPMAEVSRALGAKRVLVVHSENGLDELSVTHNNYIAELKEDGTITEYVLSPKKFSFEHTSHAALQIHNAAESLELIRAIFSGGGPKVGRDMLALNCAAIFYIAGHCVTIEEGLKKAYAVLDDGRATHTFERIINLSQCLMEEKP